MASKLEGGGGGGKALVAGPLKKFFFKAFPSYFTRPTNQHIDTE